ncbi:MAG TPA: DUF3426 domain-containing protein [Methylophilaceae bacterium]|jgi:predicted Zn finger-like uncharacterized protein
MRLVTSCPHCEAAFYVTSEQLAAHRGDVRCGRCDQVFNALDRLAEVQDAQPAQAALPDEPPVAETAESEPNSEAEATAAVADDIEIIAEQDVPEKAAEPGEPLPDIDQREAADFSMSLPAIESAPSDGFASAQPALSITDYSVPPAASILSPSMMDDAARKLADGGSKSGFGRFMLVLAILLLIILALGQAAYFLRSDIVARWPQTRPYLERACVLLQCQVRLPQNVDQITIDDSDLKEDAEREGLIHLYTVLVNHAGYRQEYPLLELTLTDANDRPVLRRTFSPEEYLPAGADIRSGISARGRIDIRLPLSVENSTIIGYRLFVTY